MFTNHNQAQPDWIQLDRDHVWHPYSSYRSDVPIYPIQSAEGVRLKLVDGRELIDGMSSWWCAIHGYNHPRLNHAIQAQLSAMAHVMFGGLAHEPSSRLVEKLISITPPGLDMVFFSDSGSVSVEVAIKMAFQYWQANGQSTKQKMLSLHRGYHGDTFGAMSVCDPVTGMHALFSDVLPRQYFVAQPRCRFGQPCSDADIEELGRTLSDHSQQIAAVILEPVV